MPRYKIRRYIKRSFSVPFLTGFVIRWYVDKWVTPRSTSTVPTLPCIKGMSETLCALRNYSLFVLNGFLTGISLPNLIGYLYLRKSVNFFLLTTMQKKVRAKYIAAVRFILSNPHFNAIALAKAHNQHSVRIQLG